jgi:hypothetical protein
MRIDSRADAAAAQFPSMRVCPSNIILVRAWGAWSGCAHEHVCAQRPALSVLVVSDIVSMRSGVSICSSLVSVSIRWPFAFPSTGGEMVSHATWLRHGMSVSIRRPILCSEPRNRRNRRNGRSAEPKQRAVRACNGRIQKASTWHRVSGRLSKKNRRLKSCPRFDASSLRVRRIGAASSALVALLFGRVINMT